MEEIRYTTLDENLIESLAAPRIISDLKIGPITYAVRVVEDLQDENGNKLYGSYSFTNSEICVDADLPHDVMVLTIVHEALHLIAMHAGVKVKERDADRMAYGVMELAPQVALMFPGIFRVRS